jgi:hypothetical protein
MILAPLFELKLLIRPWGTPVQELQIGGANRPPNQVRLFTLSNGS